MHSTCSVRSVLGGGSPRRQGRKSEKKMVQAQKDERAERVCFRKKISREKSAPIALPSSLCRLLSHEKDTLTEAMDGSFACVHGGTAPPSPAAVLARHGIEPGSGSCNKDLDKRGQNTSQKQRKQMKVPVRLHRVYCATVPGSGSCALCCIPG